jgi:dTDP-4-dehydrorhamnose 3,5-epimerase
VSLTVEKTPLAGLLLLRPRVFRDARGFFVESYNAETFAAAGIDTVFVQDNHSLSAKGTLRGLHFQTDPGQAKLIRCTRGRIWDVAVDIRPDSATFGQHYAAELTSEECATLFIPVGFAHGFLVLSNEAEVQYKCSAVYNAATEAGIRWDDPELGIPWPLDRVGGVPLLSARDRENPGFREWQAAVKRP